VCQRHQQQLRATVQWLNPRFELGGIEMDSPRRPIEGPAPQQPTLGGSNPTPPAVPPAQRKHQAERQQAALPATQLRERLLPHPAKGHPHFQPVQEGAALRGVEARRRVGQQCAEDRVEVTVNLGWSKVKPQRQKGLGSVADHSTAEHGAETEAMRTAPCLLAAARQIAHTQSAVPTHSQAAAAATNERNH
jgi:hypothetical protein